MIKKLIYAAFLGMYLMQFDIPKPILEYVSCSSLPEDITKGTWLALTSLVNAPDLKDKALFQLVKAAL
jgi:hypothetical protein